MNVTLARTFLAILEAGNLNKAAERLHVTQSTVTMRINTLEEQLGRQLLVRSKAGVELTNAGFKFQRYAEMMVQVWHQAKQEISLPKAFAGTFNIGAEYDLWDGAVRDWLSWFRRESPDIALSIWAGDAQTLERWLASSLVDATVSYGPRPRSSVASEKLFVDRLILVSREERALTRWDPDYVYVDWGDQFRREHALAYPVDETAALTFGEGAMALEHILASGGSGYFPLRTVAHHLADRSLFVVPKAPEFSRQVFVSRSPMYAKPDWFDAAVQELRDLGRRFEKIELDTRRWRSRPARRSEHS